MNKLDNISFVEVTVKGIKKRLPRQLSFNGELEFKLDIYNHLFFNRFWRLYIETKPRNGAHPEVANIWLQDLDLSQASHGGKVTTIGSMGEEVLMHFQGTTDGFSKNVEEEGINQHYEPQSSASLNEGEIGEGVEYETSGADRGIVEGGEVGHWDTSLVSIDISSREDPLGSGTLPEEENFNISCEPDLVPGVATTNYREEEAALGNVKQVEGFIERDEEDLERQTTKVMSTSGTLDGLSSRINISLEETRFSLNVKEGEEIMGEVDPSSTRGGEGRMPMCSLPGGSESVKRSGVGGSTLAGTRKPRQLPLEEILARVTHPSETDKRAESVLLMCYPSFCERKPLFEILKAHYHQPRLELTDGQKMIVQIKTLNLLRSWLREDQQAWMEDIPQVVSWLNGLTPESQGTRNVVQRMLHEVRVSNSESNQRIISAPDCTFFPEVLWDPTRSPAYIFDVPSEEVARQISLLDYEIFVCIKKNEFLGQAWKKPGTGAPNLKKMINHFNLVSSWAKCSILFEKNLKDRVFVLSRMLKICMYLERFGNFSSLCAIFAGLRSTSVYRLKNTFAGLKRKHVKILRQFDQLFKMEGNQRNLRARMSSMTQPGIPHVGLCLSDILFIEQGNADGEGGMVNFYKYSILAERIEWCLLFQNFPFRFRPLESVQELLKKSFKLYSEDTLYSMSVVLEPPSSFN